MHQCVTQYIVRTRGKNCHTNNYSSNRKQKIYGKKTFANAFGRLMKGVGKRMENVTEKMAPILFHNIPTDRKVVYCKNACDVRPEKVETHRSRIVIRGDQVEYPDKVYTPTTDIAATKILLNSIISTKNGKTMSVDIKIII